jgi:hypothetical protein
LKSDHLKTPDEKKPARLVAGGLGEWRARERIANEKGPGAVLSGPRSQLLPTIDKM